MPVLWAYARDLFQTPGFGDTVDFVQIKQHYYIVHADINPTRIVPKGPDLSNWLTPHGREAAGRQAIRGRHAARAAGRRRAGTSVTRGALSTPSERRIEASSDRRPKGKAVWSPKRGTNAS